MQGMVGSVLYFFMWFVYVVLKNDLKEVGMVFGYWVVCYLLFLELMGIVLEMEDLVIVLVVMDGLVGVYDY